MDNRHLLLAEQYDRLGLYRVADNLDTIRLSQFPGQPEVETDPHKVVEKNKSVPKKNTNIDLHTKKPDVIEQNLAKMQPVIEKVEPIFGPLSIVFSITELNNLSKQALEMHALEKLTNIARKGAVNPAQIKYFSTLLKSSKIQPEIKQLIQKTINNQIPRLNEINALMPNMPNIGSSAKSFLDKMKAYAIKNPAEAKIAENVTEELGKKISVLKTIGKTVPIAFVLLNALILYPEAKRYFLKISAGDINEIWDDAESRAKFLIFLADMISFFTAFFPPLAPLTSALIALSTGYQGSMYAYDKYKELSGEKEKEKYESDFTSQMYGPSRSANLFEKYKSNLFDNFKNLIWDYTDQQIDNSEVRYVIRVLLYPELLKFFDKAAKERKLTLNLKQKDVLDLPVFKTGIAISEQKDKNGQYKTRKLYAPDFMKNPTLPQNLQAFYDLRTAIIYIVNDANYAYDQMIASLTKAPK